MKRKRLFIIFLSCLVIVLTLIILEDRHIYLFDRRTYIDLNSCDIKYEKYIFSFKVKDKIETTPFSQEVRRLDIDIPNERIWKFMFGHAYTLNFLGTLSDGKYRGLWGDSYEFLFFLDEYNITGNDRIAAIKEALDCLKNVNPYEVNEVLEGIINKYKNMSD